MFSVEAERSCKFAAALVVYQVTEEGFLCYTTIVDSAPAEMRGVVGEYLHRANYGFPNGNFEFDYDEGFLEGTRRRGILRRLSHTRLLV